MWSESECRPMAELEVAEGDRELGKEEEVRQGLDHLLSASVLWCDL